MSETTIAAKAPGGVWQYLGRDRFERVVPESLDYDGDKWGPREAKFVLRRRADEPQDDLPPFTEIKIEDHGEQAWSGFTLKTPPRPGREVSVECRGWPFHLDDDLFERSWVHDRIGEWRDVRSHPDASLTTFPHSMQVETGEGGVLLSNPEGVATAATVGAFVDVGEGGAISMVVVYESSGTSGGSLSYLASNTVAGLFVAAERDAGTVDAAPVAASNSQSVSFTVNRRYVLLYLSGGAGATTNWVRLKRVPLFYSQNYRSAAVTILKASMIVADVLPKAPVLSQDTSLIDPAGALTFVLPSKTTEGVETPRAAIEAANAVERAQPRVRIDKRLEYRPLPSVPIFEVGDWPGWEFTPDTENSGEDVHNAVEVLYTGTDGQPGRVRRDIFDVGLGVLAAAQLPARTFEGIADGTNVSGWTASVLSGSPTITFTHQSAGGGANSTAKYGRLRWSAAAAGMSGTGRLEATISGLVPGFNYALPFYLQTDMLATAGFSGVATAVASVVGVSTPTTVNVGTPIGATAWAAGRKLLLFKATAASHTFRLDITMGSSTTSGPTPINFDFNLDELAIYEDLTLVGKAGRLKAKELRVTAPIDLVTAQRVGDLFMQISRRTPLRGTLNFQYGGLRRVTGEPVHPSEIVREGGELVRFRSNLDPVAGTPRQGRIITASRAGVVQIDNTKLEFEALMSRIEAVQGG